MNTFTKINTQNELTECLPSCEKSVINPSKRFFKVFALWMSKSKQRSQLAQMNDSLLDDIGVTHAEAEKESTQPFWR